MPDPDDDQWWACPDCKYGFVWNPSSDGNPGACVSCADKTSNCENCHHNNQCIKCHDPYIVAYNKTACIIPFKNCAVDPSQYTNDGTKLLCPECKKGFYFNPETESCDECKIEDCMRCVSKTQCVECEEDLDISHDGSECRGDFSHCTIDPKLEDYPIS